MKTGERGSSETSHVSGERSSPRDLSAGVANCALLTRQSTVYIYPHNGDFEKLIVAQLVNKGSEFYGNQMFIALLTTSHYYSPF